MNEIKRILIINRSILHFQKAIHLGVSLAKKYGARLYIVHVFRNPLNVDKWGAQIPNNQTLRKEYESIRQNIKNELYAIISLKKAQGIPIKEIIKEGASVDEVLEIVEEENVDLVIMLAHKEGRFENLFDQEKQKMIRAMPCSVLLVNED